MTTAPEPRWPDSDAGFTLVELIVAMMLSVLVLLAILTTLDGFSSNVSRQARKTDANEQVRKAMDRIVTDLRQAASIVRADSNDLIYTVADSSSVTRYERVCLDASSRLWRTTTTTPITLPTSTCGTAGSGTGKIAALVSSNSSANPIFRYNSTVLSEVRSVGLTFALNAGTRGRTDVSTLRASTFVRRQSEASLALPPNPISTSCSSTGQPTLTLAASAGSATVSYVDVTGSPVGTTASAGTGVVLPVTTNSTTIVANITSGGLVSQILKTIECPV